MGHRLGLIAGIHRSYLLGLLLASVGQVCSKPSHSARLDVPGEFQSIAEALVHALPGDSVAVYPGYYQQTEPLVLNTDEITLYGTEPHQAWVYAEWLPDILVRVLADGCTISGLGFQYFNLSTIMQIGFARDSTVIRGNYFDGAGGSDAIKDAGRGTQVIDNEFAFTIVPYSNGFVGSPSGALVEANRVSDSAQGLDIHNPCTIRNNSILATRAGFDYGGSLRGGGIFAHGVDGPLVIEANEIGECHTISSEAQEFSRGGGVYVKECSDVRIERNRLVRNQALTGGGICAEDSGVRIAGNLVWANGDSVGGNEDFLGVAGGMYLRDCTGTVENNTVLGNRAGIDGGGLYLEACPELVVQGNIVADNWSEGTGGVVLSGPDLSWFACNDVWENIQGNYGGDWEADPSGSNGNLSVDPEFCFPDSGNFTLSSSSPCAGLGDDGCGLIGAYGVGCSVQDVSAEVSVSGPSLRVFPNPTRGAVRVELTRALEGVSLSVVDAQGRRVRNLCQPCVGWRFSWDGKLGNGSPAPAGIYHVVRGPGERGGQKLVLIR